MWPYWFLFFFSAFQAVSKVKQESLLPIKQWSTLWRIFFVLLAIMIGLRHEVGGDWANYLLNIEATSDSTLAEALAGKNGDPGDSLLNWIASKSGLGVYLINSVYSIIFTFGLLVFCRNQPRPWLALAVAVPYLVTVVAMGYSRQGVAIGLIMLGLVALENKKVLGFIVCVSLAALFHKSAVIMIPLALLARTKNRMVMLILVSGTAALLFALLLQEHVDALVANYIVAEYKSSGAAVRVAMNAFPAALFLLMRKRFGLSPTQRSFWSWIAMGALAFVVLLYASAASTAIDRVALYFIPLQLFVWSRIPDAMGRAGATNVGWVYVVLIYSATVYFVWLFFANHSNYWLPYKFYPWIWLWR
jgi:hypothetical protein